MKDSFNRNLEYMRISVTDRCDLRCRYCAPLKKFKDIPHPEILRYEEILKLMGLFTRLGINKFRITGGEPLMRKGIIEFIKNASDYKLYLTTNLNCGTQTLTKINALNLTGINVSLDTLDKSKFEYLTGGADIERVIENLKNLRAQSKKINTVIIKNINDNGIDALIEFSIKYDYTIRFIEKMSLGDTALETYSNELIIARLLKQGVITGNPFYETNSAALYYKYKFDESRNIGFISPHSRPFCELCGRLRLSADGKLYTCLFTKDYLDIKKLLRAGADEPEIINAIKQIIKAKPATPETKNRETLKNIGG